MPVPAGYQLVSPTPRPAPQAQAAPTGSVQPVDDGSAPAPQATPLSGQTAPPPPSIQKIYSDTASGVTPATPPAKYDPNGSFLPGIYEYIASKVEQSRLPGSAVWADNYRMQKRGEIADVLAKESKNSTEYNKAQVERYSQLHGGIEEWSKGLNSEAQRAAAWPQMLSQMEARGLLKQGEADAIGLGQYPGDAGLEHVLNGLAAHNEVSQYGLKSAEAREKNQQADEYASPAAAKARQSVRDEADAKAQTEQLKVSEGKRANTATILGSAVDKDDYAAKLADIDDPKLSRQFPQTFDPATTPNRVSRIGMTSDQRAKEQEALSKPDEWGTITKAAGGDPQKAVAIYERIQATAARARALALTEATAGGAGGANNEPKAPPAGMVRQ
jgi:hypothetical protein